MAYIKVQRMGDSHISLASFESLKAGDTVFHLGTPVEVAEDAHFSGDASYPGYLFYDPEGEGWFPEDLDTGE